MNKLIKIDWKTRFKNPLFWGQIGVSVLTPILAYNGLTGQDLTSWSILGKNLLSAVQNPYVLSLVAVSVFNTVQNPTTKGLSD